MGFLYACLCRWYLCLHVFLLCFLGFSCSVVLSYSDLLFICLFILFYCYSLAHVHFLRRERNGVDLDGRQGREDLGGVGKWENTIEGLCMKQKSIFN